MKKRALEQRVRDLLERMTLAEKIGQMNQLNYDGPHIVDELCTAIAAGQVGSVINADNPDHIQQLQEVAACDSRLGIPLLIGRDVIHGFKTIMPIPLGQAASWNPTVVRDAARVAAREASADGINWTFAPMSDVTRDPRWGRIAESMGEDPVLGSRLVAAMVEGFQGDDLTAANTIAACAKHFAGYGAVESGRDYATTDVTERQLRNLYLPPFKAAVDVGVASLMTSFSDIDGVPATASQFLLRQVLRDEWSFDGMVVSDWDSVRQLSVHGLTENDRDAALAAATAGVDMEMVGQAYVTHLAGLIEQGAIDAQVVDDMVANVLRTKFRLGLFDQRPVRRAVTPADERLAAQAAAYTAAAQSVVMLKNRAQTLPLDAGTLGSVAVIGPLADAAHEQMGTWVFDGDITRVTTPLQALKRALAGKADVQHVRAMATTRSRTLDNIDDARALARASDVTLLFLGEESILSGEAHSRADIDLPGAQLELARQMRECGKPVVAVIMAGRPLTLTHLLDHVDAVLFAWHPGAEGGPALVDLLLGHISPSGKLPVTFPRMVGQIPIYHSQKNTGKPPSPSQVVLIDDIETEAAQTSFGMTSFHLDAGYQPLFEFGFGLSYAHFEYADLTLATEQIAPDETLIVRATLRNTGPFAGDEIVQLYVRDLVGSLTRPVKELKDFTRVHLAAGAQTEVSFALDGRDLAFFGRDGHTRTEPGAFHVWIGGSSATDLRGEFRVEA